MSREKKPSKTCMGCGLEKQLSAFLQINGPEGTTYGSLCSTCRGSGAGKTITLPGRDEDRHSTSSTGVKIDSKAKNFIETEKKHLQKEKKDAELKESKKRELTAEELIARKDEKLEAEKQHREEYLEPKKKESFLNYQSKKPTTPTDINPQEREAIINKSALDHQGILGILQNEEAVKQDEKVKNIDLSTSYVDPSQTGLLKYQSAEFHKTKALQGWLDSGAIGTYERQFLKKPSSNIEGTKAEKPSEKTKPSKDPVADYINKNFDPASPGTRRR